MCAKARSGTFHELPAEDPEFPFKGASCIGDLPSRSTCTVQVPAAARRHDCVGLDEKSADRAAARSSSSTWLPPDRTCRGKRSGPDGGGRHRLACRSGLDQHLQSRPVGHGTLAVGYAVEADAPVDGSLPMYLRHHPRAAAGPGLTQRDSRRRSVEPGGPRSEFCSFGPTWWPVARALRSMSVPRPRSAPVTRTTLLMTDVLSGATPTP